MIMQYKIDKKKSSNLSIDLHQFQLNGHTTIDDSSHAFFVKL